MICVGGGDGGRVAILRQGRRASIAWRDQRVVLLVWRGWGRCISTWRHDPPGAHHAGPCCTAILPQCRHLDNLSKLGAGGAVAIAGLVTLVVLQLEVLEDSQSNQPSLSSICKRNMHRSCGIGKEAGIDRRYRSQFLGTCPVGAAPRPAWHSRQQDSAWRCSSLTREFHNIGQAIYLRSAGFAKFGSCTR